MKKAKSFTTVLSVLLLMTGINYISSAKTLKKVQKEVSITAYNCGNENIKVTYPTKKTAKVTDSEGKVYNLRLAKSAGGTRYTNIKGIEFFTDGRNTIYTGPSGIENTCTISN